MHGWDVVLELITILASAIVAGAIFERIRLGATIGYILAGIIIGPKALGLVQNQETVNGLAEFGIALVLFATGLEFSILRLKKLGTGVLYAGIAQILFCIIVFAGIATAAGQTMPAAFAIGAIASVSSTVIIIRILRERGELDATHGKISFGILLIQDVALVPLALLVTALGNTGGFTKNLSELTSAAGLFVLVIILFLLVVTRLVPRALDSRVMATSRELPILIGLVTCVGAAWAAHTVGVSASLGAFIAGLLLAETPTAHRIRSDIAPFRALFGTVFFVSVGMLADATWIFQHLGWVLGALAVLLSGKVLANFIAIRLFKRITIAAAASAIVLAQVGELGFILIQIASVGKVITPDVQQLLTAVAIFSMMLSPLLVRSAPRASRFICTHIVRARTLVLEAQNAEREAFHDHFVVVGMGTAGKTVAAMLTEAQYMVVAVDNDPKLHRTYKGSGTVIVTGDATQYELMEELHLNDARALILAIPDHRAASLSISLARQLAPDLPIVVRSRNHAFQELLTEAGATVVVGEEALLGRRLGELAVRQATGKQDPELPGY